MMMGESHDPEWRFTLSHRFNPKVQLAIQWSPDQEEGEFGFIGNYIIQPEFGNRPHISIGTSSDRLGTHGDSRAYYLTLGKTIPDQDVGVYGSISYSESEKGFIFPFGMNLGLGQGLTLMPVYDGKKTHLMLDYRRSNWNATLLWIFLERPGISFGFGF